MPTERGRESFWRAIDFINRLNRTNPNWTPYDLPEEFKNAFKP